MDAGGVVLATDRKYCLAQPRPASSSQYARDRSVAVQHGGQLTARIAQVSCLCGQAQVDGRQGIFANGFYSSIARMSALIDGE